MNSMTVAPRRKFLRYWILIAIIIVAAGTGLRFAKPIYHEIRGRQAAALAREARALIELEDWREASNTLRKAYRTSPREPEVIRTLAKFYSFADLKRERKYLNDLFESRDHNDEDLRRLILLELRFRDLPRAVALTKEMLTGFPQSKENLSVAVAVSKTSNDVAQTENLLRKMLAIDPDDNKSKFEMAQIQIQSSFGEKVRAGWEEIYKLARGKDETGLEALRLIVRREPFYPGRVEEIHELTRQHPDGTENDHIAVLGWRYEIMSSETERSVLLDKAIEERLHRPHEENRSLFFWLNSIEKQKRVLELLPEEIAVSAPGLLTVYVTAMIQENRFDEIRKLLESEDRLENSSEVFFIKAQCAVYLNMSTKTIREYLQESYELALLDKRTAMLSHIADFSDDQGMRELAQTVYQAMANIPETSLMGYEKLLAMARSQKDLARMRSLAREIREKVPGNPVIIKLTAYLELLYGANLEAAYETIRELSERAPQDHESTMILAFAHYRFGDLVKAEELCRHVDLSKLTASQRAVFALIRGASGDALEALSIAEKIPRSLLLTEELDLIRPWLPSY